MRRSRATSVASSAGQWAELAEICLVVGGVIIIPLIRALIRDLIQALPTPGPGLTLGQVAARANVQYAPVVR